MKFKSHIANCMLGVTLSATAIVLTNSCNDNVIFNDAINSVDENCDSIKEIEIEKDKDNIENIELEKDDSNQKTLDSV